MPLYSVAVHNQLHWMEVFKCLYQSLHWLIDYEITGRDRQTDTRTQPFSMLLIVKYGLCIRHVKIQIASWLDLE